MLHARQLGLKLIANTTFGYTAASYSGRMPCVEVPYFRCLHAVIFITLFDNVPFNYPVLNYRSLKTVSSIDVYLNLDDCILHYSPMCFLNFVHIVR